uniref:uncharacterized protein LOC122583338 n=1 Tax=Erigeron canadensis TaxID=72917 RepID=UPI001CB9BE80|nr:uncharacterized protein LOC122583338 [Erigeron canadensis]
MVRKYDGGWRMCVDFTDINKACPKDCYPLPEIDWKVESLVGFRLKCFLDAYKGYHQIQMHLDDEDKTAFYMSEGIFCYKRMPFGLKNAGATYQRLVDRAFGRQIGRNLEVYVNDMVIKSRSEEDMFVDIEETFKTLRSINMKLNPKKCSFGVEEGQFLGHMITKEGFRADPEKVKDIQSMKPPQALKEIQSLNGKLAALHRFLSKSADKSLPFFHTLKGCLEKQNFKWTEGAQKAFTELKDYLCQLPTKTAPIPGETLQMYLAASEETISAVLIASRKGTQQPIYYVSRVLQTPEMRYPEIEKLTLALVHAAQRLRRYFQAHPIQVLTDKPIKQVLTRPEVSGRLAKWAVELGEHEIEFKPRSAIKGQILAYFLAEVPVTKTQNKRKILQDAKSEESEEAPVSETWKLFTDGASSMDGSGAGLILTNPEGHEFTYALRFDFKASNNAAEFTEALLAGLRIARQMKVEHIHVCVDSQIVAFQVDGTYEAKDPAMKKYLEKVRQIRKNFKTFRIQNISRSRNKIADALSKLASTSFTHLTKEVLVETLPKSSMEEEVMVALVEEEDQNWTTPIIEYLTSGILPANKDEARKVRIKAPQYILREEGLYRKSYLGPLLRCVGPNQAKMIIEEIHQGCCGAHTGPRMVVAKITKMVPKAPKHELIPVTAAWPFSKWGINIVGPFPQAPGRVKFLVVAVDYFTKWIEAKPLVTISGKQMEKFVWEQVVTRFGIPQVIISDNGKQFSQGIFPQFCKNLEIQQRFTSVAHPQANGQVEAMNKQIVHGIKTRFGRCQNGWLDGLHQVLGALRMTPKTSNGETPFSLVCQPFTDSTVKKKMKNNFDKTYMCLKKGDKKLRLGKQLTRHK